MSHSAILWNAAHQASLSFTISWSLLKLMSIESVMPYNHLIFCHPLLSCLQSLPALGSFLMTGVFVVQDTGGQTRRVGHHTSQDSCLNLPHPEKGSQMDYTLPMVGNTPLGSAVYCKDRFTFPEQIWRHVPSSKAEPEAQQVLGKLLDGRTY